MLAVFGKYIELIKLNLVIYSTDSTVVYDKQFRNGAKTLKCKLFVFCYVLQDGSRGTGCEQNLHFVLKPINLSKTALNI